jgi:hypothetical protein
MPGITLPVQLAVRSVAYLLEEAAEMETADKVVKLVLLVISPQITKIQDATESISSTVLHLKIAEDNLKNITLVIDDGDSITTTDTPESINTCLEKMQEAVVSLGTQIKELPT